MARFKLANIVFGNQSHAYQAPSLYCRSNAAFSCELGQEACPVWKLAGPGSYDFTTYINALSVRKWQLYTQARSFALHVEVQGACAIHLTRGDSFGFAPIVDASPAFASDAQGEWQALDIALPVQDADVVCGFVIEAAGEVLLRNTYYFTELDDACIRPVELALCTTTFMKEDFITRNVDMLRAQVMEGSEQASGHVCVHVVDNGRTLEKERIESAGVFLHANPNAGGAGGFARGMLEAMAQEPVATHVLLMDDDVEVLPESILRTYNLLAIVNEEYEEAFLSGAMMRMDEPNIRHEDMGFYSRFCQPTAIKPPADMSSFEELVRGELLSGHPEYPGWEDQGQIYAAWWYCVIPMSVIKRAGLPLPIFVRYDDVEYGLRCKPRIMTMNGICVWHLSFDMRRNPVVDHYQTIRNGFILKDVSDINSDMFESLKLTMRILLGTFNYEAAELALQGFEDYLAGPQWLMRPAAAENAFMKANGMKDKLLGLDELRTQVLDVCGLDIKDCDSAQVRLDIPWTDEQSRAFFERYNGQLTEASSLKKMARGLMHVREPELAPAKFGAKDAALAAEDVAIVNWASAMPQLAKACGKKALVAIDPYNRKGVLRTRDAKRFASLWKRYQQDLAQYEKNHDHLREAYCTAMPQMTSCSFWQEYLGIHKD